MLAFRLITLTPLLQLLLLHLLDPNLHLPRLYIILLLSELLLYFSELKELWALFKPASFVALHLILYFSLL